MDKTAAEQEILAQAVKMLHMTTGLHFQIGRPTATADKYGPDAMLIINHEGTGQWKFFAEIISILSRATLGIAVQRLIRFQGKGILITRYVTPPLADELRKLNIQFMDVAGNAYINAAPLYVFIKGNKPVDQIRTEPLNRAFRPAGLQVIFALLCNKGCENAPFRDIAHFAAVALGTVGQVMKDLKEMGFLVDMGHRGRRLTHKENLMNRWVTAYPEQLRPKLVLGRFAATDHNWWKAIDILKFQGFWGGEIAAAKATEYLKPQKATIYMAGPPARLIMANKMKKAENGDIEILKIFWNFAANTTTFPELVPPLLVYADLLATGDPRNIETAQLIYEKNIIGFIKQD